MIVLTRRRLLSWVIERCIGLLEPSDRDAVLGDLTEEHASTGETLREILEFLLRRQAALWLHWRPWLALICVAIPFAILLAFSSRETAGWSSIYVWLCANNLDRALLADRGFWHVTLDSLSGVIVAYTTLIFWSWASGCLLGVVARKAAWLTWVIFCCVSLLAIPFAAVSEVRPNSPHFDENAIVVANQFYHFAYPLLLHMACVLLPSLLSVAHGRQLPLPTLRWLGARRASAS